MKIIWVFSLRKDRYEIQNCILQKHIAEKKTREKKSTLNLSKMILYVSRANYLLFFTFPYVKNLIHFMVFKFIFSV